MRDSIRFVALGDSFTEGVGDHAPALPNGVRGWADRVAEQLSRRDPSAEYANLAIRGKKLGQVVDEQVDAALALTPTLVSLYAGANDILRPRINVDELMGAYDDAVGRLASTGAAVVLFTGFDPRASAVFSAMRGRTAVYNELVREIADRRGATLVDYWRFDEYDDPRMWATDRMHMSAAGHRNMARRVLDTLDISHAIPAQSLGPRLAPPLWGAWRANASWARRYAGPWVGRRLRGVSSGDGLAPRFPRPHRPGTGTGSAPVWDNGADKLH